jgi:hypothetical protein
MPGFTQGGYTQAKKLGSILRKLLGMEKLQSQSPGTTGMKFLFNRSPEVAKKRFVSNL